MPHNRIWRSTLRCLVSMVTIPTGSLRHDQKVPFTRMTEDTAANIKNRTFGQNVIAKGCFKNWKLPEELKLLSPMSIPGTQKTE